MVEIFKLYELRYLLLKIYPLIHLLFQNPRLNSRFKFQSWKNKSRTPKSTRQKKISFSEPQKNLPPQILFATTTEAFADIILQAAHVCNMPHHKKRWVNGFITAAISDLYRNNPWDYIQNVAQKKTTSFFATHWSANKENSEKTKEKSNYYRHSRWPSLIVIPDLVNNEMILSEIKKVGLPVIGLVNSHCALEIDYPIFAQDQTYASVYFFCHFLATLISKEMAYTQHKHYITQRKSISKKKSHLFALKSKKTPNLSFLQTLEQQKKTIFLKRFFFLNAFVPAKKKSLTRYDALKWGPYRFKFRWVRMSMFHFLKREFKKRNPKKQYYLDFETLFGNLFNRIEALKLNHSRSKFRWPNLQPYFKYGTPREKLSDFIFRTENQNKLGWKKTGFFSESEKEHFRGHFLRNFLWIFKKINLHWQSKMFTVKTDWYPNNRYYWWTLRFLISDVKWQQSKYILHSLIFASLVETPSEALRLQQKYKKKVRHSRATKWRKPWQTQTFAKKWHSATKR